jgi:hypothetical protein
LDASDENYITVSEWWQLYSKAACKGNVQQPMDELKSIALNGCWEKIWSDVVNDF